MAWLSTEFYFYKGSAPCRSVWMCIKALKVDVEEKTVDLLKCDNKRPWFVRLNPQHTVPVLSDQGYVLWESRAIMQYLCNKYATEETQHLYPTDPEQRGRVDRMLFFDMGTFYQAIKEYFAPKLYNGLPPDPDKENMLKQSLDYLDNFIDLDQGNYLLGDKLTIADFALLGSITELDALEYNYKCYGEVYKWSLKVKQELPYYKKCCTEGIEMQKTRIKALADEVRKAEEKARKASIGGKK
ncbi:glutathione S-transferase 1-like [Oratosquilla oratoria]|uniref:glutathione S-transferase 1-like n=1 Tax=Oratosquilla oratoria TaxID=337810 RepID=UPI003F768297